MEVIHDWELLFTTDDRGHPMTGLLIAFDQDGQRSWASHDDFGPFDRIDDVTRWLLRAVHAHLGRLPR